MAGGIATWSSIPFRIFGFQTLSPTWLDSLIQSKTHHRRTEQCNTGKVNQKREGDEYPNSLSFCLHIWGFCIITTQTEVKTSHGESSCWAVQHYWLTKGKILFLTMQSNPHRACVSTALMWIRTDPTARTALSFWDVGMSVHTLGPERRILGVHEQSLQCFFFISSPSSSYSLFKNPYWKITLGKYNLLVIDLNRVLEETNILTGSTVLVVPVPIFRRWHLIPTVGHGN